jgi:NADP-dependent 3-hydroxy acid dehydrogenase YdfG
VILSARNIEKTRGLANRLTARGFEAHVRAVDASDASNVTELIADIDAEHGPVDVLHYNAANLRQTTFADQAVDTFASDLAVNIGGALAAATVDRRWFRSCAASRLPVAEFG